MMQKSKVSHCSKPLTLLEYLLHCAFFKGGYRLHTLAVMHYWNSLFMLTVRMKLTSSSTTS